MKKIDKIEPFYLLPVCCLICHFYDCERCSKNNKEMGYNEKCDEFIIIEMDENVKKIYIDGQ